MPAYDFRCTSCRHTFEVNRAAGDTAAPACPVCGADTKRVFTPVGVHFKGSGFHNTDYKPKKAEESSDASCPSAGSSSS